MPAFKTMREASVDGWIERGRKPGAVTFSSVVTLARIRGSAAFTASTMASVEALPFLVMVIKTPREPLVRTILFCT